MPWHAAQEEEVRQDVDHVDGLQPPVDPGRPALMAELVDQVEYPVFLPAAACRNYQPARAAPSSAALPELSAPRADVRMP